MNQKKYPYFQADTDHGEDINMTVRSQDGMSDYKSLGYFGNIWVRSHYFKNKGDTNGGGHYHHFDHVTLLAVGSVLVEVEGQSAKQFDAPTFIVIKKDLTHKFTALTDGVVYYCVYALRNSDGELTDTYDGSNTPYEGFDLENAIHRKEIEIIELKQKLWELEKLTTRKK